MLLARLAWREFVGSKLLWGLSAAAVALGVATVVSADVVSGAVLNAMQGSADVRTLMGGLTELLGSNLTVMGAAISLASGFVVFNAFAMSVARRRIRIATMRSAGMTRRQLLQLTLLESLLTGLLGVSLGLAAGPLLGALAIAGLKAVTAEGMFVFEFGPPRLAAMALAAALGLLVSIGAALAPAMAATRVPPLAGRRQPPPVGAARPSGRTVAGGLVGLLLLTVYLRLAPPAAWLRPPWDGRLAVLVAGAWLGVTLLLAPDLAAILGRLLRQPLQARIGASGLLVADNLRRDRRRVSLTVASLAMSLALVVSVMGFTRFTSGALMGPKLEQAASLHAWSVEAFDPLGGMAAYGALERLTLEPENVDAVRDAVRGRAKVLELRFTVVPELSYFGDGYFTFVIDPSEARLGGDWLFTFNQGNWQEAIASMEGGCGALVMPPIALRLNAAVGETVELTGTSGPVSCTLAGVGAVFGASSIVGTSNRDQFGGERPFTLFVEPLPGVDRLQLDRDLAELAESTDGIEVTTMENMAGAELDILEQVPTVLNAMAVLAVIAAALGVVNTVTVGVVERRREFGLYRAVGATRGQMLTVVVGEAALIAALAGGLGVLGGIGVTIVIPTVYGGGSWGILDMDYWFEAMQSLRPALILGLIAWASTPIIGAVAGLLPARALLRRRRLVEVLLADRH